MNQPLGVIQLQPLKKKIERKKKKKEGGKETKTNRALQKTRRQGAYAEVSARILGRRTEHHVQELNENSFLAQSMCVSVLSSSLLFAVEFIIICSTVVSGGQHGAVLGARQTPHAARPLEAECGAGELAPKHPF